MIYFWSDKPVDDLVCSLSPLSGPLPGAAAPLVGIDGWGILSILSGLGIAVPISEYPLFIFATHKQIFSKTVLKNHSSSCIMQCQAKGWGLFTFATPSRYHFKSVIYSQKETQKDGLVLCNHIGGI